MRINLTNPVNWSHPLNKGRVAWWYTPQNAGRQAGGTNTGRLYDLCKRANGVLVNGASNIPQWYQNKIGDPALRWITGAAIDGHVDVGGGTLFDFTDNFTVGCRFNTETVTTANSGLGGLLSKYQSVGSNAWTLRRKNDTIEFGGSTTVVSATIAVNTEYRCVVVMKAGTATIYLNGAVSGTPGAVSISSTPGDSVLIGETYEPGGFNFQGWQSDWFVSSRPWSSGEVMLDFQLSGCGYRVPNGPLRMFPRARYDIDAIPDITTVSFTTLVGESQFNQYAVPANFVTEIVPSAAAGGIGDLVPEGNPDFETVVGYRMPFGASEPTLVNYNTLVTTGQTLAAGNPIRLTTTVGVHPTLRTVGGGDARVLSQGRYRR